MYTDTENHRIQKFSPSASPALQQSKIGIYRNGAFYLRNSNTAGNADMAFGYGIPGDTPLVGNWDGT
jgi:hypothetical protein